MVFGDTGLNWESGGRVEAAGLQQIATSAIPARIMRCNQQSEILYVTPTWYNMMVYI